MKEFFFNNMKAFKKINIVITLACNIHIVTFSENKNGRKVTLMLITMVYDSLSLEFGVHLTIKN